MPKSNKEELTEKEIFELRDIGMNAKIGGIQYYPKEAIDEGMPIQTLLEKNYIKVDTIAELRDPSIDIPMVEVKLTKKGKDMLDIINMMENKTNEQG